jgi:signal transduction histidine kinase
MSDVSDPIRKVLFTERLWERPVRRADHQQEATVLAAISRSLMQRPAVILQAVADSIVELCGGTGGISLLEEGMGGGCFRWAALSGEMREYAGGKTDRRLSPSGVTLELGAPQLFIRPGRAFPDLAAMSPAILEGLVIPFGQASRTGTAWVVTHRANRQFDGEDVRIMTNLASFASAAYELRIALAAANKAEREARVTAERLREANRDLSATATNLQESNEELERFNREATTQLQTPLCDMRALLDEIGRYHSLPFPDGLTRKLNLLSAGCARMHRAIDDLSTYARFRGQRSPDLPAGRMFLNSGNALQAAARAAGLTSAFKAELAWLPVIAVDPGRFARFAEKVLQLAIAGHGIDATISISAEQVHGACLFSVVCRGDESGGAPRTGNDGELPKECRGLAEALGGQFWSEVAPGGGRAYLFTMPDG